MKSPKFLSVKRSVLALCCWLVFGASSRADLDYRSFAGSPGDQGTADGSGASARFSTLGALTVDSAGFVYVGDGPTVRKVSPDGVVTTLAGVPNEYGDLNGVGAAARFRNITGIAVNEAGDLFVTEAGRHTIRKVTAAGEVSVFAGSPQEAGDVDAIGITARFEEPRGLAFDFQGNLFVADAGNRKIRRILPDGTVTTFADGGSSDASMLLRDIGAIAISADGDVYVAADTSVQKVTDGGVISIMAGSIASHASVDGVGEEARFSNIGGLAFDEAGNLFVSEPHSKLLRLISASGLVSTVAGQWMESGVVDGLGDIARFNEPVGLAFDQAGNLFIAEAGSYQVRKGSLSAGVARPVFMTDTPWSSRQIEVASGTTLTLSAVAGSFAPVSYQWYLDGEVVVGATARTYVKEGVGEADEGQYSVSATNAAGTSTFLVADLDVFSPSISSLETRHARSGGGTLRSIAAGDGLLVAVGDDGLVLSSRDGRSWSQENAGTTATLRDVAFGEGKFVAVGDGGTIMISPDAQAWSPATNVATTQRLNGVVFGAGQFVAVGEGGALAASSDGVIWTPMSSGVPVALRSVSFAPWLEQVRGGVLPVSRWLPRFIAGGVDGTLSYHQHVVGELGTFAAAPFALGFDINAMEGHYAVGPDGSTAHGTPIFGGTMEPQVWWVPDNVGEEVDLFAVANVNGTRFVAGQGGRVFAKQATSLGGSPWASVASGTTVDLFGSIAVGNSLYVVGEDETILGGSAALETRLSAISSRGVVGTGEATLISGFAVSGTSEKQVLIRAAGPELARSLGLAGAVSATRLAVFDRAGKLVGQNVGWSSAANASDIAAAAARVGTFPFPQGSGDSAMLVTLPPGSYTAHVASDAGPEGLGLLEVYDADVDLSSPASSRLVGISTRAKVGAGDQVLIAGVVVHGTDTRRLLVRANGPALAAHGIEDYVLRPTIAVFDKTGMVIEASHQSGALVERDQDELRDAAKRVGLTPFASGSDDLALPIARAPGIYTVHVGSVEGAAGVVLVEVYDLP